MKRIMSIEDIANLVNIEAPKKEVHIKSNPMLQIPKIKLVPTPETPEASEAIGYKWNKEAGTRHFLGGEPTDGERLKCEACHQQMTFYAQIDSIGHKYDLADCMVIHTYVCFDCFTVKSLLIQIE